MQRARQAFAGWLIQGRVAWVVVGLLLTAAAYPLSQGLNYNRSMEGFFPRSDPRLHLYLKNKAWFGGEANLIVVYTDPQLWTPAGMDRQLRLAHAIKALADQGVRSVVSLADRPAPRQPLLTIADAVRQNPEQADALKEQVRQTYLYQGVFVADDGLTTALVVQLQAQFRDSDHVSACLEAVRDAAHASLREVVERGDIPEPPVTAGTLLMIHDVYAYTERDGRVLEVASVLAMGLVIAASFRSVWWVALPLVIVYAAIFWSRGVWAVVNGELTMVSSAISSLAAVIGVSTVVHFGLRFHELRPRHDTAAALRQTFAEIGPPVFWILATTAGGFAALLVCDLKPVLDFAWIMVLVSMLIGVTIMAFLPLGVMGFRNSGPRPTAGHRLVEDALVRSMHWIRRRPWLTSLALIVPFSLLGLGMLRLQPQTDFTNNFRRNTEIYRAYDFIERKLGGAGQMDLVFDCPDLLALPEKELQAYLERLRALGQELARLPHVTLQDGREAAGVTKVLGLVDFLDFLDSALAHADERLPAVIRLGMKLLNKKSGDFFTPSTRIVLLDGQVDEARKRIIAEMARQLKLPAATIEKELPAEFRQLFEKLRKEPPIVPNFWYRAEGKMRVVLQARERLSSDDKQMLISKAEERAGSVLGAATNPQATGIYVMLTHLIDSLLEDQKKTFVLSLLCQFGMGVLAFGSFWLALITMVPTVLPVAAVVGTMGWLGLPVNIATAMLASVAMGMTIDSSILYLYRFKQERREGADFGTALMRTHATAGIAVVISNLALVVGFGVLVLSRFIPLVHFGIFTSLALVGGMVGNLLLLPLLLHLVPGIRRPMRTTQPSA